MNARADRILEHLQDVAQMRARSAEDGVLAANLLAIKTYQQRRFTKTYADLLAHPIYAPVAEFFLQELYGPNDFTDRDLQFARTVPALVRLLPDEVVSTVTDLAALHALSELLDTRMATALDKVPISASAYLQAWQQSARPEERSLQIELVLRIGRGLDRYTRSAFLRHTLRLMRKPAAAAGLAAFHRFLQSGFDTFGRMVRADEFLATIQRRETRLAEVLFAADLSATLPATLAELP